MFEVLIILKIFLLLNTFNHEVDKMGHIKKNIFYVNERVNRYKIKFNFYYFMK